MRISNIPIIYSNDARVMIYEFKKEANYRGTYSSLWCLRMIAFDPGRLSVRPGNDWDRSKLLKLPLAMDSIPHFLVNFATFVLPILAASNLIFISFGLLMYYGIC